MTSQRDDEVLVIWTLFSRSQKDFKCSWRNWHVLTWNLLDYINISKVLYYYMSRCKCTGGIQGVGLGWFGNISISLKNISSLRVDPILGKTSSTKLANRKSWKLSPFKKLTEKDGGIPIHLKDANIIWRIDKNSQAEQRLWSTAAGYYVGSLMSNGYTFVFFRHFMPLPIRRIAEGHYVLPLSVQSIHPSVCLYIPLRVWAITPKPYGIYSWNFTCACIILRQCVMNKEDNSCILAFWIISPWLSFI